SRAAHRAECDSDPLGPNGPIATLLTLTGDTLRRHEGPRATGQARSRSAERRPRRCQDTPPEPLPAFATASVTMLADRPPSSAEAQVGRGSRPNARRRVVPGLAKPDRGPAGPRGSAAG